MKDSFNTSGVCFKGIGDHKSCQFEGCVCPCHATPEIIAWDKARKLLNELRHVLDWDQRQRAVHAVLMEYENRITAMEERKVEVPKQLNIGDLCDLLRQLDVSFGVAYDFSWFRPDGIHSYRGDYSEVSLGYTMGGSITVLEVLKLLKGAIGKAFPGWKGGMYQMRESTPVWVDNCGEGGGTGIVGVRKNEGDTDVILLTAKVEA